MSGYCSTTAIHSQNEAQINTHLAEERGVGKSVPSHAYGDPLAEKSGVGTDFRASFYGVIPIPLLLPFSVENMLKTWRIERFLRN